MIKEIDFISSDVAEMYAQRVLDLKQEWANRGVFSTLGASAYIDQKPNCYMAMAMNTNPLLLTVFASLYLDARITLKHEMKLWKNPEMGLYALPGFHIFSSLSNGVTPSIHIDKPYEGLFKPDKDSEFSFTVPLKIPSVGAGLNWWDDDNVRHFKNYEVGKMYIHYGRLLHQINNDLDIPEGEYRITLQGHGAKIDGQTLIYF